jgi:coproporphyrinogen III oxidase-like Fe-S oxidoreductase
VSDPDQDSVLPDPRPGIVDATARGPQAGDGIAPDTGEPGFAVYLHWPFCAAKCPYCDFNSHVRHAGVDQQAYVSAFGSEIAAIRALSGPQVVTSVFFGGGTPSLMKPETVAAILDAVRAAWAVPTNIEITLEANPSSVEADRFRGYREAGVNRVSMGVQALNDADLKRLGRLHDRKEALKAISLARDIFPRMSFDLIYARPDQTTSDWVTELNEAISLASRSPFALPTHHRGRYAFLQPAQGGEADRSRRRALRGAL